MAWKPDPLIIEWQAKINLALEERGFLPDYVPLDGLAYSEEFRSGTPSEVIVRDILYGNPALAIYAQQTLLLKQIIKLLER